MAGSLHLGERKRRGGSGESWLLLLSLIVTTVCYYRYVAPTAGGSWEAASTQIHKKFDRVLLFHPAWERGALHDLPEMPVVMLDGPQHLDLAGLREVLFASEGTQPEAVVNNLFVLTEWRDFAGKAVAVLRVAERGLSVDFSHLSLAVDDPPGIATCDVAGDVAKCNQPNVIIERRHNWPEHASSRCLWVRTNPDRPLYARWKDLQGYPQKRARLFAWRPTDDDEGKDATIALFSRGQRVAILAQDENGETVVLPNASDQIEVVIDSPSGACFDVELMP